MSRIRQACGFVVAFALGCLVTAQFVGRLASGQTQPVGRPASPQAQLVEQTLTRPAPVQAPPVGRFALVPDSTTTKTFLIDSATGRAWYLNGASWNPFDLPQDKGKP